MTATTTLTPDLRGKATLAGVLYAVIIVAGIWGEAAVRAPLLYPDDPQRTATSVQAALGLVRASLAT
ncbi:MAG: DUF4386 family protein, partial [Piscinibacter sp.]|uniref:DUF4386 family protein n=1 Tax=Piscinibacter sp. TaxID=1903157 RepID=UPI003D107FA4